MTRNDLGHLALAICLIAIAGYVDAIGFLKLGHLFVSFMSGNSTQFSVAASQRATSEAERAGILVLLFVVGVVLGRLCARWAGGWRRPAVLVLDTALLALAVFLASSPAAIVAMVLAMGVQNEALHKVGSAKTAVTYVTGTLVSFGEELADAFSEPGKRWVWVPHLLLWIGLVIGAAIGARIYGRLGVHALQWPAAVLLLLTAITAGFALFGTRSKVVDG